MKKYVLYAMPVSSGNEPTISGTQRVYLAADVERWTLKNNNAYRQEVIDLRTQLAAMTAERDEHKEIADWFSALVRRATIGTADTPSLRAYIEQVERQLATSQARCARLEGAIQEAVARLERSSHSAEQPEPYESRTPIVRALLQQALTPPKGRQHDK